VYVVVLPAVLAPVFELQAPVPAVPVIVHVKFPVGAAALRAPVTVAVTVSLVPRTGEAGMFVSTRIGAAGATTVVEEAGVEATFKYVVSPVKMKLAP
jgi:hypothetical protein